MYKIDGNTVINTVEDLLPVFNNNTEMTVAALNILETSFLEAPILLNTPISLVLSSTEMYVIIPIIIEETISDIATNAINT